MQEERCVGLAYGHTVGDTGDFVAISWGILDIGIAAALPELALLASLHCVALDAACP